MFWRKQRKVWNFFVPITKKITKIDKEGNETVETRSYKIKLIDIARFMAISLSNFVDNLTKGIHKLNVTIVIVF